MKEKILELREKGYSYQMIAKELGCSKSTISYHLGDNQKKMAYQRVKKQRILNPWLKKQENFLDRFKNENVTYNSKYFDRKKIKDYLDSVDKCYLTGRKIDTLDVTTYEFDHIIPLSKGGMSSFENLGITIPEANRAKYDLSVEEFIELCKDVLINFGYTVNKMEE
jgi:CRISPR/Cas system Type II protein with McrA/HNH and RuvC-like nuclease domain